VQIFKFLAHSVQKLLQKNSVTNSDHISHSSNGLKSLGQMFDNFLLIPVSPAKLSIIQLFLREKVFV
jgi:hypothetical protein